MLISMPVNIILTVCLLAFIKHIFYNHNPIPKLNNYLTINKQQKEFAEAKVIVKGLLIARIGP